MKMVACLMLLAALVTLAKSGTLQLNIYTIMILCLKYILYVVVCQCIDSYFLQVTSRMA